MQKKRLFCIVLIIILLSLPTILAESNNYYTDTTVTIDESGNAQIEGNTNYLPFQKIQSNEYTTKNKDYWKLNISENETFSEFVFTIKLPENAVINYIKSQNSLRITEENNRMVIILSGENQKIAILVQYIIQTENNTNFAINPLFLLIGLILLIGLTIYGLNNKKKNLKHKENLTKESNKEEQKVKKKYNLETLTERQKEIIKILEKAGKPVTQAQLEKELKIPKSSLSRNIESLVRREIIVKEKNGMSNMIYFKEDN